MTHSRRPRRLLGFRRSVAPVASAIALVCSGLVPSVHAGDRHAGPPHDAVVLSEIAEDVLRRASGAKPSPVPIEPDATTAAAAAAYMMEGEGIELAPDSPFTSIAPAREGITVPTSPGVATPGKAKLDKPPVGYRSNSWRQGKRHSVPALSFSSGVLAPSSGLDAALQAQGVAVAAQGRPFVYGFVLLTVPRDKALEQQLAGLGVHLLGPHDDHHKARLPVGSLAALATLPEVAWLGMSEPEQKLSVELAALRGPQGEKAGVGPETPIPIVINLFEGDDKGTFRRELEAVGAALGKYDPELASYRAVATGPTIEKIAGLDFVLFVELIGLTSPGHDQSTPLIDADIIRPGTPLGHTRFSAATVTVGVLDTGFEMGGGRHVDLNKFGCGINFTDDGTDPFEDADGHGTHVLGTIAGTGTANPRYRGVATGLGSIDRIRVAKIWKSEGNDSESWMEDAMDFMSQSSACGSVPPEVINISGGHHGVGHKGTDTLSRKLDGKVWTYGQAYVVCSGNEGPLSQSIRRPGVAKNALTVGQVYDWGYGQVGDASPYSSQGPTGDGRMKPNLVAPGASVTSAKSGTTSEYAEQGGCSMATPHVTGLAATLMDHYPDFRGRPALLRAHLMATAIGHEDSVEMSNIYGLGRTSGYLAHWDHPNSAGWQTFKFWGGVSSQGFQYNDITVPPNTKRLIVVLTWDEPAASAGASRAVTYDLDLWIDHEATCGFIGDCGDYQSVSFVDNVEYIVVENPPPGLYRLKAHPWNAPTFNLRYGLVARIIRGDPTPAMTVSLTAPSDPKVGSTFTVTLNVNTPSYVVSGAQVELTSSTPPGLTFLGFNTRRHDGVDTGSLDPEGQMTLGNLVPILGRSATWTYRADAPGPKAFTARVWSENGGEVIATTTVNVVPPMSNADLVQTAMTTNPPAPIRAPGTTFSVTDTVQNAGTARSGPSTTRYYLSVDAVKSADDTRLTGSHAAHGLDPGASHSATVTVTIPTATPPNAYVLIACADDQNTVSESNESNNCIASPGAIVAVARPDLVEATATTNPPAPIRAPGTAFSVTDTVRNLGPAPSGSSTTRYYLSLDAAKSAGDTLLIGSRALPGLAAGSTHTGTVTVAIPAGTPLNTYFLLACADDLSKVMEAAEGNNCTTPAAATVTVTRPDLLENTVSAPPATKQRGTSFTITDTVHNVGAVASGSSATRYYLSLDAVKGAGDTLLTGSRTVSALAAGGSHSGTATVTIPSVTPLNTYFLLACADAPNTVVEADETNNCKASGTTVTVTP